MGYDAPCPDYPCLSPHCRSPCCQDYQYEREHIHPTARYHHHSTHPRRASYSSSSPSSYYHDPHYSRSISRPTASALHEARTRLRHEAALAREIDKQTRANEKSKLEKEAKEQIENVARGKAEREKDAERGKKAREGEAERKAKKDAVDEERERVRERGESDDGGEGSDCGDRAYVTTTTTSCRKYYRGGRGEEVRFVERRYSKGRRGSLVVVTRQRAPRWLEYLM